MRAITVPAQTALQIKARQLAKAAGRSSVSIKSEDGGEDVLRVETPTERMGELRERSALSRLAMVADAVYMCGLLLPRSDSKRSHSASQALFASTGSDRSSLAVGIDAQPA
jgi:hypothetical protein